VTPSLLDCDFARVGEEIRSLEQAGVRAVHLDVMDGHFVPNLSYGPPVVADWRKRTDFPFDAHLMMTNPGEYAERFIKAGSDIILFHIEVMPQPTALLRHIRSQGCRAGLVLNPPTAVEAVLPFLDEVDSVLVMSVMPGFGGQKFQAAVLEKVRTIRKARPGLNISIDGGINKDTAEEAVRAGVSQMVVGSATGWHEGDYREHLRLVEEAARRGLT
jgi:ribulose-phosphate 3-epimerase